RGPGPGADVAIKALEGANVLGLAVQFKEGATFQVGLEYGSEDQARRAGDQWQKLYGPGVATWLKTLLGVDVDLSASTGLSQPGGAVGPGGPAGPGGGSGP